jgi:hypothetical protein
MELCHKAPEEEGSMSTSLLYHAFGLVGYHYVRKEFREGQVVFHIEQLRERLRCSHCGSTAVWSQGSVDRTCRLPPIGAKPVLLQFPVPRVRRLDCGAVRQVKIGAAGKFSTAFNTSLAPTGSCIVMLQYAGDSNFKAASNTTHTLVVNKDSTTTDLSDTAKTTNSVTMWTFSAVVTAAAPGSGTPTGTVTFMMDGKTVLAKETLINGKATYSFSSTGLTKGQHTITAIYSGDGDFVTSTELGVTITV